MVWYDESERECHSGLYLRKFKGKESVGFGLEMLFDTVQEVVAYVEDNYSFTDEDVSYHIEDTYGHCYAIVTSSSNAEKKAAGVTRRAADR